MHLLSEGSQTLYIQWAPITGCFKKGKITGAESRSMDARGWGWEERLSAKGSGEFEENDRTVSYLDSKGNPQFDVFVKIHRNVC